MKAMKMRCPMNVQYFPFDKQSCLIVFSSWTHTSKYLNYSLKSNVASLQEYNEGGAWELVSINGSRIEIKYEDWIEDDYFSEIQYTITLKRKPLYIIINCVMPALILSVLTIASFLIPFAQQTQIGISIILSFSVLTIKYKFKSCFL